MAELTIRLVVSLAIVVGLLLLLAKFGSRKFRGNNGALVQVVHRQPLSRTSSVAVVTVGTRVLVLGTTEQQVSVLAELDPDELELDDFDVEGSLVAGGALVAKPALVLAPPLGFEASASALAPQPTRTVGKRAPGSHRAAPAARAMPTAGNGPLAGSVLSPQTWKQALAVATSRSPKGTARRAS